MALTIGDIVLDRTEGQLAPDSSVDFILIRSRRCREAAIRTLRCCGRPAPLAAQELAEITAVICTISASLLQQMALV